MIAVVRAEDFYTPPPELPADIWADVPVAERVWRWVEYRLQRRLTPPEGFLIGEEAWAAINHNRWVADCTCGSAQVVSPADQRMACTECGRGWVLLVFPADVAAVEAALVDDEPHLRNWVNPEAPAPAPPPPPPPPKGRPIPGGTP
ncbi:hypothetical protein ACIQKB_04250 [Streptomyces sp. NPDC092046]|uniref:hypothetical protein n=1 Tax=Streptomyces sp. NPDC092046 TaxID=3366009 RepID=UPI00381FAF88